MAAIDFPFDAEKLLKKCALNNNFPRNDFEKQAVLIGIMKDFRDGIEYPEEHVNLIVHRYFSDHALIRRELVNFGYMKRDPIKGIYTVLKRGLSDADIRNNTLLRRHAKAFKVLEEDR